MDRKAKESITAAEHFWANEGKHAWPLYATTLPASEACKRSVPWRYGTTFKPATSCRLPSPFLHR